MSNVYGLDFLKSEHNLPAEGDATVTAISVTPAFRRSSSSASAIPDVSHKSDLEKQSDVLIFLRHHRSSGCLPPSVIYKSLGIDLSDGGIDSAVATMLVNNPKVNVEEVPDPENPSLSIIHYGYRAKFSTVRDRATLLAQINRCKHGIKWSDLTDAYDDVDRDLQKLLTGGEILGVSNPEERDKVLFPRGEYFLVELDGCVTVDLPELPVEPEDKNDPSRVAAYDMELFQIKHIREATSHLIKTDIDPRTQIRRGEAIRVGNEWFRVSSAVKEGVPLGNQPPRAQAPLSVVSMKDLSKKNEVDGYVRRFDQNTLPLDGSLSEDVGIANLQSARKARERLHAIAGGEGGGLHRVSGGASATLLSSVASEKNSSTLAGLFAKSVAASFGVADRGQSAAGGRKRPTAMIKRPGDYTRGHPGSQGKGALDSDSVKRAVEDAKKAASDPSLSYSHAVRHGCTKDVRDMYLETLALIPTSEVDLHKALLENKLIDPGEKMSRPRMKRRADLDNDGKPKKRRYYERKNMRRTNTHLDGTDIGAMLAVAAERQSQGKEVGDGGM
jgi:hypothetical protein